MFLRYSVVAIFALINIVSAVPITKCKAEDSKCIKDNTQVLLPLFVAGIPELGVEAMDPLFFKHINASNEQLNLQFNDVTLTGLKTCRFKKITRDAAKHVISAKATCDVVADGHYFMDGRVLVLPINGKGKARIENDKIEIAFEIKYKDVTGADGKAHWGFGKWTHSYDYKGEIRMKFDNLFNGNELLASAARELMKTSPVAIAKETAGPVVKVIAERIMKNLKAFFDAIPVEDLALD